MPTYIDESGDTSPEASASDEFLLTAAWFETIHDATACQEAIANVRSANGWKNDRVFHFCECAPEVRRAFLSGVSHTKFHFVSCTIKKRAAEAKGIKLSKQLIITTAAQRIAERLCEYYHIAEEAKGSPLNERIKIHHHDNKEYIGLIRESFSALRSRKKPKAPLVKKTGTERAESEDLIQLVDMVCGAVRRKIEGHRSDHDLILSKEIVAIEWP